jgi:hypothetical protein
MFMSKQRLTLCGLVLLAWVLPMPSARAGGMAGKRLVARATVRALPAPLRASFETRIEGVVERALEPSGAWTREARYHGRRTWGYLYLDADATGDAWGDRMHAARTFPRRRAEARRIFRLRNIKHGGRLPWALDQLVDDLSEAFEQGDMRAIVRNAGYIAHYCEQACDPFATTRDPRGAIFRNFDFGPAELGNAKFAHQDVGRRIGGELVRRNQERYGERIEPDRLRFELAVEHVPFAALEWMVASFEQLPELCEAERALLTRMGIEDFATFSARADEYYELLDSAVGPRQVENLRRAVRASASLIVTAWTRAGSPDLDRTASPPQVQALTGAGPVGSARSDLSTARDTEIQSGDEPVKDAEASESAPDHAAMAVRFVASRNSKVFHRADCPHAAKISARNRVEYADLRAARASGKRPCRSCHPERATDAADSPDL